MKYLNPTADPTKLVTILNSDHDRALYADHPETALTENDPVMIETLLRSIDERLGGMEIRLQKVSDDVVELKIEVAAVGARLCVVEKRLDRMDERFDRMDQRFDRMDQRFERLESRNVATELQLSRIEVRIDQLPTWKTVGAAGVGITFACGGVVVWLAEGGARAISRLFD